jgi:hypothetical protein
MALPMRVMKAATMKSMRVMKAMKAMKAKAMKKRAMKKKVAMKAMKRKAMKVSKVAMGKLAKAVVFRGGKEKTVGGLTKASLTKNTRGKVVSRKASARGKKVYATYLSAWTRATMQARKALGITGFCPVGGKTATGKALYAKAKELWKQ